MTKPTSPETLDEAEAVAPVRPFPLCLACAPSGDRRALPCHLVSGRGRVACEAARVRALLAWATPTNLASPHIVTAPARGATQVLPQFETLLTPTGSRVVRTTRDGFHPVAAVDAFDLMALQARRRKPDAPALFSVAQVLAGRDYAVLAERVAAEGIRCSSFEGRIAGVRDGSWMDGVIARSGRLSRMRAAIGDEVVLAPHGAQAHADRGRRPVHVRRLLDEVCCERRTVAEVIGRAGWARNARTTGAVKAALAAALDRLWGL